MANLTLVEAVNQALAWEMAHDDSVVVFGEDVGLNGGVFRATVNLQEKFGKERVFDTPLAEAMIAGLSVGLAAQGFKPIPEIQFMGFIYPALDQIISHASRLRNRTRGRLSCPMVLRAPFGTGIRAPEHHSESTEALFAHMPGVRVVIPSSPVRAYGLLLSAIRDPDPVVFLEPKRNYRAIRQEVEDNGEGLPLDKAFITRPGTDLTLITWGASALETWNAAGELAEEGIDCEVMDLATVSPMDRETILESVGRTGRAVIVHEAALSGGLGAEVAAILASEGLYSLEAPVIRVAGYDAVPPLARMEYGYIPSVARIKDAVRESVES